MVPSAMRQLLMKSVLLISVLIAPACGTSAPTPQPILPTRTSRPTPTHTTTPVFSGTLTPVPQSLSQYFVEDTFKECLSRNGCRDFRIIDVYEFPASANRDGIEEQWCLTFRLSRYDYFGKSAQFWNEVFESHWLARSGDKWFGRGFKLDDSPMSCGWAQETAGRIVAEPTSTKDIRTPTPTLAVSKCLVVTIVPGTPSGTPNPNNAYGAREPELAKNAPNGACLEIDGEYVIKRIAGTPININWHVAWNPNANVMVVKGIEWAALGIDNDGMHFLRLKADKLYFMNSDIPVLQVIDSDYYIGLINMYEFMR